MGQPTTRAGSRTTGEAERLDPSTERRRLVTLWLAVLATLAVVPGGFSAFVLGKLLVVGVAALVTATVPAQGRLPRAVSAVLAVGAAVFVVAAVAGDTPWASLVGRWPRYEGLPTIGLYVVAAWIGARLVGPGARRQLHLVHAVAAMTLVLFASSVLDVLGASPLGPSDLERSGALLGNATDQGLVAMMAAVVLAGTVTTRRTPYLLGCLAAALVTVAISGSRISLGLTAVSLLLLAGLRHRRLVVAAVGAVAVMLLAAVAVPTTRDRLLSLATGRGRLTQWDLTLDMVLDRPLLGFGPSRYIDTFGRYETVPWVRFTGADATADSPHDVLLQALVVGGVPLLLCLVALVVVCLRRALRVVAERPETTALLVAVGAYGTALLANFTAAGPTCLAALLAGVLLAEPVSSPEPRWRRPVHVVLAGATCVVLLAACIGEVRLGTAVDEARAGDTAASVLALESAQSWRPWDSDVAMLGAQPLAALASAGDAGAGEQALRFAGESLARTPDTYAALVAGAVARLATGDLDGASAGLDRAIVLDPVRPTAWIQRGVVEFERGDYRAARRALRRARNIYPRAPLPRQLLKRVRGIEQAQEAQAQR